MIDPAIRTPDREALIGDLKKILTVGIGHPPREPFEVIEQITAQLGDSSLAPLGQVEEVVRDAIAAQGRGSYPEAIALVFGAHEDTADVPKTEERREVAAVKLHKSPHTLKTDYEPAMCGLLADHLLERYSKALADQNAEQDEIEPVEEVPAPPLGVEHPPEEHSAGPSDDHPLPEPGVAPVDAEPQPPPPSDTIAADDPDEQEGTQAKRTRRPIAVMVGIAVAVITGAVVLLTAGSGSSAAHHRAKVASLGVPVTVAPFSPARPTYDYDIYDPNDTNCANPSNPARQFGRCGAETGHALDSFINTPSYGDERFFFDARLGDAPKNTNTDPLTGITVGDTVVLRVYVDNNTAVNPSNPEISDTRNTRVRVDLAHSVVDELAPHEWVLQPQAFVSASNAQTVEDGVNLVGSEPFALQYEPGSAMLLRNMTTYPLTDEITGSQGAPIGLLYMNGDFPAGNNFDAAALIELRARAVSVAPPEIRITNQVRMNASKQTLWHSFIYAKPGDDVQWLLNTSNGPWSTVYHVITRDELPSNLEVIQGSVNFTNARGTEQLSSQPNGGPLFGGGYDAGAYNPRDNTLIAFTTKVLGNFNGCRVIDRTQGYASSDQTPIDVTDDADVVITKPGCSK